MQIKLEETENLKQDFTERIDTKEVVEKDNVFSAEYLRRLTPEQIIERYEQVEGQAFVIKCTLLAALRDKFPSDQQFGQYIASIQNHPIHPIKLGGQPRVNKMIHVGRFCAEHNISDLSKIGVLQSVVVELARPKYKEFGGKILHNILQKRIPIKEVYRMIDEEMAVATQIKPQNDPHQFEEIKNDEQEDNQTNNPALSEKDLYPLLMRYLEHEHDLYCRRIDEKRSKNRGGKGGSRWLHPDIVAMEKPKAHSNALPLLWSFEVKRKLTPSTARLSFLQTLGNSGWANVGYLVAPDIDNNVKEELQMLSKTYGIGVILLNQENPIESKIYFGCQPKYKDISEDATHRLRINTDFDLFITMVEKCHAAKCIVDESYWNDYL